MARSTLLSRIAFAAVVTAAFTVSALAAGKGGGGVSSNCPGGSTAKCLKPICTVGPPPVCSGCAEWGCSQPKSSSSSSATRPKAGATTTKTTGGSRIPASKGRN